MMRGFYLAIYVNDVDNDVIEAVVIKLLNSAEQTPYIDKRKLVDKLADKQQMLYPALDNYPV